MPLLPTPFQRSLKWIRLFAALLVLCSAILSLSPAPARASETDNLNLAVPDQEVYAELASGKKVQQPKSFIRPEEPTVYLTFDDGPSKLTPKVLDILQQEGVPATFFEIGEEAEAFPDIVKRVVKEGHAIGNHTYDHVYNSLYGSFAEFWRQVRETDSILGDIAGIHSRLIRAPGGTATNFDAFYFYYLDQAGYTVYDWNIDSGDSNRPGVPAQEIIDTVKRGPFEHEVTVLMHDGTGHGETVKALPEIIKLFKDKGYAFASLSEKVKPEQFGITKSKWQRSVPMTAFAKQLAQARAAFAEHTEQAAPVVAAAPPEPLYNDVPLQVRPRYLKALTVAAGGYELKHGTLRVPVRQLAERLHADISWDETKRVAKIHYGCRDIEYDLAGMAVRTYTFGRLDGEVRLADMKVVDGSVWVPLRRTAALFGYRVSEYSMDPENRFVALAPWMPPFFAANRDIGV